VTIAPYGDVAVDDGALELMDHNNGDGRVHVMTVSRDARGSKLSWADRPGPRTELRSWSQQLWALAPSGRRSFPHPASVDGKPAYEWAFVLRRGEEVRVVDGGVSTGPDPATDFIEGAVDFLDMHF
jgi:hypothetical protein